MNLNFSSDFIFILFFFLGISIVLFTLRSLFNKFKRKRTGSIDLDLYSLKSRVLTENELAFFEILKEVIKDNYEIFSMIRMADIFSVQRGKGNQAALNRISSRHIDFLLCEKGTLRPVAAIELDDKSHERPDRMSRDDFVNQLFDSAGLPLLRFPAKYRYTQDDVSRKLNSIL